MAVDATTEQVRWAPPRLAIIVLPFRLGMNGLEAAYLPDPGGHRLLSAVPGPGEPLDDAAQRISHERFGRSPQYVEQLYTFDSRPGAAREVVVSYLALFRQDTLDRWAADEFAMQPNHVIDSVAGLPALLGL